MESKKYELEAVHFYTKTLFRFHVQVQVSNTLQKFIIMTEILTPVLTYHSPVLFSFSKEKVQLEVKGFGNLLAP